MKVFVFKPSNKNIGKFDVDSLDDIPAEFQKFAAANGVSPFDYLECSGQTWTVVRSEEGVALQAGRVDPTSGAFPDFDEEANSTRPPVDHYKNAYSKANTIENVGSAIKTLAIALFILIAFGGLILSVEAGGEFFLWSIVSGLASAVPIYILGIIVSALGQILKATLDTAVNTSPFLATEEKASAMSRRQ